MKTITIEFDRDAESPREWDNIGTLWVPSDIPYVCGDEDADLPTIDLVPDDELVAWALASLGRDELRECARTPTDRRDGWTKADAIRDAVDKWWGDFSNCPESLREVIAAHCVLLPVYAYVHGGVSLSTGAFSCPWDSGAVGFIWCTLEAVEEEYGDRSPESAKRARDCMEGEIQTLDTYYRGCVYGFVIEDTDEPDTDDSCWGFLGETIEETEMLDHIPAEYHDAAREAFDNPGAPVIIVNDLLEETLEALSVCLDRLHLNNCEGEEDEYIKMVETILARVPAQQ